MLDDTILRDSHSDALPLQNRRDAKNGVRRLQMHILSFIADMIIMWADGGQEKSRPYGVINSRDLHVDNYQAYCIHRGSIQ